MCVHRLHEGPLVCTRPDTEHDVTAPSGHVYTASWAADNHDATEANDD